MTRIFIPNKNYEENFSYFHMPLNPIQQTLYSSPIPLLRTLKSFPSLFFKLSLYWAMHTSACWAMLSHAYICLLSHVEPCIHLPVEPCWLLSHAYICLLSHVEPCIHLPVEPCWAMLSHTYICLLSHAYICLLSVRKQRPSPCYATANQNPGISAQTLA